MKTTDITVRTRSCDRVGREASQTAESATEEGSASALRRGGSRGAGAGDQRDHGGHRTGRRVIDGARAGSSTIRES